MMCKRLCFKMEKIDNSTLLEIASETSKPLFLIGFMGCGKSTSGALISQKTGKEFIDLDIYITQKHNKSIPEIFENEGEQAFRLIEHSALKEIINIKNIIVATGGGTPCFFDNMELMSQNGITVYLKSSTKKLFERLISLKNTRPLLSGLSDEELEEREKYYLMSSYEINSIAF